jgi:ribose 1,5-bisphosphokinase
MSNALDDTSLPTVPQSTHEGKRLIYLMGASGSGKDTLIRHLRTMLDASEPILVAHRYITRPSGTDEASVPLSEAEFIRRIQLGCFALHWHSHHLHYGIGIEIDTWLANHAVVIVNGSRKHLARAYARYPKLQAIEVTADLDVLAQRLAQRGRETTEQIQARLQKAQERYAVPDDCQLTTLTNNTQPEDAARRLYAMARERLVMPPHALQT